MPIRIIERTTARVISLYDDPAPLRFFLPSIVPGTYMIPGVTAPQEQFASCQFSFPNEEPLRYAVKREAHGVPYVEITVVSSLTIMNSTDEQTVDEYGKKLEPPVRRIRLPIEPEHIANEMESQVGFMGLMAIDHDVPTAAELADLQNRQIARYRQLVQQTNRLSRVDPLNITDQARRAAWTLYQRHLLADLPDWAIVNPTAESGAGAGALCPGCRRPTASSIVRCPSCGSIQPGKWKEAVELGLKSPVEVPPSKRVEAGLDISNQPLSPIPSQELDPEEAAIASSAAAAIRESDKQRSKKTPEPVSA